MQIKDFSRCCRCCLVMAEALKPLFGTSLDEMLIKLTNLQVAHNDRHPQQICSSCILKLSMAHTFYLTVMKSQKTLEDILKAAGENQLQSMEISDHAPDVKSQTWTSKIQTVDKVPHVQQVTRVQDGEGDVRVISSTPSKPEIDCDTSSDLEEGYQCSQCEHTSKDQHQLEIHLQTHIGAKCLPKRAGASCMNLCNFCGKHFRWRTSLFKHIRQHKGRGHQCAHCRKEFAEASSLNVHLISHSLDNPKPFHCELCNSSFSQKSSLKKHAIQHQAVATRPRVQCAQCQKRFFYKSSLKRHLESVHSPEECPICHKILSGTKSLDKHIRGHKKDEIDNLKTEPPTDNVMTESFNVQAVTVEFMCLMCTKKFPSRKGLKVHICSGVANSIS